MLKKIFVFIFILILINIFSGCTEQEDNEQVNEENGINISCSVRLLGNNILLKHRGDEPIKYDSLKVFLNIGNDSFNISSKSFELLFGNDDKYWEIGESFAVSNDKLSLEDVLIELYIVEVESETVIIYATNKYGEFIKINE